MQIRTIATQVAEHMGAPVTFAEGAGPDTRDYRVDFAKITRAPARLPPAVDRAPTGSSSSPPTWSEFGLTAEDFEGPRYVRLARIRELLAAGRARRRPADAARVTEVTQ